MAKVLIGEAPAKAASPARGRVDGASLFAPAFALGLLLCLVAAIDLGFVWFPLRFGNGEWELVNSGRTFDAMTLPTVGLVLLAVAAALRGSRWLFGAVAAVATLLLLCLLLAAGLYALNVPVALGAVPDQAKSALVRSMVRTALLMSLYLPMYGWFSWFTWRRFGAAKREVLS